MSTRTLEVSKPLGPLGVGLRYLGTSGNIVQIVTVLQSSPLFGRAWPGEILRGCSTGEAGPNPNPMSPDGYSAAFNGAAHLSLTIETPVAMLGATSIRFFRPDTTTRIGFQFVKDEKSGLPRLKAEAAASFRSIASQLSGADRLAAGDLIVGITYAGKAYATDSCKAFTEHLQVAQGDMELRIVRDTGQENAAP